VRGLFRRNREITVATPVGPHPSHLETFFSAFDPSWFSGYVAGSESVGTVDRCLQLNAQQVATMPLRYRHADTAQPFEPAWVHDPDPAWYPNGISDAVFSIVWSIYGAGEAFLWVTSRYATGFPATWTLLAPATMGVSEDRGVREYRSGGVELDPADVLHVMRNPNGGLRGRSAVSAYWANVASAYQAEVYAADVYQSSGVNRMALQSTQRLDAEQAADLQAQWVAAVQKRLGAPAILPPDVNLLEALTVSPKDLMLIESRDWDARQIAAAFGVPAMLLNIAVSGGMTYQNPAMLADLWWRTELMPCAAKVAAALSRWLPRGHWVEFDPSQILRPDLSTMVSTWSTLLADQVVTPDEYRAAVLDLPPLERGDQAAGLFEEAGAHGADTGEPAAPRTLEVVQ